VALVFAEVRPGLHYAESHEWVKVDGDVGTVGITDHAQVCRCEPHVPIRPVVPCLVFLRGGHTPRWNFQGRVSRC
jgi:hypothetical protein